MVCKFQVLFVLFLVIGCANEGQPKLTKGIVADVSYEHIGKNKYKKSILIVYSFEDSTYSIEKVFWNKYEANYQLGDTLILELKDLAKGEVRILEKVNIQQEFNYFKLE